MRGTRTLALVVGLTVAMSAVAEAVTIDWVTVGDAGNTADYRGFGAVPYEYRIGKYEITAGQYTEFLNAKAATDPYGLYNADMWSFVYPCKIQQSGSWGSYSYSVASDWANRPVNFVSFWDAARFANWMHNGQGSGDTETGAYTLTSDGIANNTVTREPDALFFMPTVHEWFKAAYYKGGGTDAGYWVYPTQSDTAPTSEAPPGTDLENGSANCGRAVGPPYYMTEVGAYTASPGAYGTFDQGGNLWEWNETGSGTNFRVRRGGSWQGDAYLMAAWWWPAGTTPAFESYTFGFRLASPVPEPGTLALLGLGVAALLRRRKRRA